MNTHSCPCAAEIFGNRHALFNCSIFKFLRRSRRF